MVKAECRNTKCRHEWEYKGKQKFYCTCPKCGYKVKIEKKQEVIETRE